MDSADRPPVRIRDFAWLTLAAALALFWLLTVVDLVVAIAQRRWGDAAGGPLFVLCFYWMTLGAWRRTHRGRRRSRRPEDSRDPGWRIDAKAAAVMMVPGAFHWYLRRSRTDLLVALRSMVVLWSLALVAFAGPASLAEPHHNLLPWIPLLIAAAAAGFLGDWLRTSRPLDCSSDERLAVAYMTMSSLRFALAVSVALLAFAFVFIGASPWLYEVGAAFSLIRLWTGIAPTRAVLARDQRRLDAGGCNRSLVGALRAGRS